ncbi:NAD(P)-binding protein [Phanerochaete sordida]|uniref:NAD(P)-binding protein n=1 Tax=Phanerochaete sordida TaxID=48140 RepID=A0A9P3GNG7_9APHY|nr:NAD(P)-binding protein [Phanerochaete sordida]
MTILLTAASGRTSGFVLRELLAHGVPAGGVRLMVRSEDAVRKVQAAHPQLPRSAFVIADFLEASTLGPALAGVDTVFHNAPGFHALEGAMGVAVIEAAKKAGVKHFVYCSVLFPVLSKLLNHDVKRGVEEFLIESGLDYTILEPTSFMQNMDVKGAAHTGALMCAYTPQVLQGFVDLADLAQVARLVLLDPAPHNRARYELVGENMALADVAKTIARVAGLSGVACEAVPRSEILKRGVVTARPGSAYATDALDRMLYYYDKRGIPGNNNTLRWLLGREPTSWEGFVRRELQN